MKDSDADYPLHLVLLPSCCVFLAELVVYSEDLTG